MEFNTIIAIDCAFKNCGIIIARRNNDGNLELQSATIIVNEKDYPGSKSSSDVKRSEFLYTEIKKEVVSKLDATCAFAYETPSGSQSARAAKCLGMAAGILGAISMEVKTTKLSVVTPISPNEVKRQVSKTTNASKEDIMHYVSEKYNIPKVVKGNRITYTIGNKKFTKTRFEHIADAIVIAEVSSIKLKTS